LRQIKLEMRVRAQPSTYISRVKTRDTWFKHILFLQSNTQRSQVQIQLVWAESIGLIETLYKRDL